jgi:hypothetical protein
VPCTKTKLKDVPGVGWMHATLDDKSGEGFFFNPSTLRSSLEKPSTSAVTKLRSKKTPQPPAAPPPSKLKKPARKLLGPPRDTMCLKEVWLVKTKMLR